MQPLDKALAQSPPQICHVKLDVLPLMRGFSLCLVGLRRASPALRTLIAPTVSACAWWPQDWQWNFSWVGRS